MSDARILVGDVRDRLNELDSNSIRTVITSPPYWGLRDYGHDGQIGVEDTAARYVAEMVAVFREVRRSLTDDGTLWLNLGDTYTKGKHLAGIPWRVAFALQADGWILRQDIIWQKPNPMPESVRDRCTKSHEYVFLMTKSERYHFDHEAISEEATDKRHGHRFGGDKYNGQADPRLDKRGSIYVPSGRRNKRDVWTIPTQPFAGAHFAVMPEALAEVCVLAGSRPGDSVLDPFTGSGTVGVVALRHDRRFLGVELNPDYANLAEDRISRSCGLLKTVTVEATREEGAA